MTDEELVKRLREAAENACDNPGDEVPPRMVFEAADAIERLTQERDAMKADLFEARNALIKEGMERDQAYRDRDAAREAGHEDAAAWMERCGPEGVKMAGWFRGQMEACRRAEIERARRALATQGGQSSSET